jgi:hypothetical protein
MKYILNIIHRMLLIIRSIVGELFRTLRLRLHVKIQFSLLFHMTFVAIPECGWIPRMKCDVPWFVCGIPAIQHIVAEPANYVSDCVICSE